VILVVFILIGCSTQPTEFWKGQTTDNAVLRQGDYTFHRDRDHLEGASYEDVVKLFGPGKYEGEVNSGHLFVWSGPNPYDGGL